MSPNSIVLSLNANEQDNKLRTFCVVVYVAYLHFVSCVSSVPFLFWHKHKHTFTHSHIHKILNTHPHAFILAHTRGGQTKAACHEYNVCTYLYPMKENSNFVCTKIVFLYRNEIETVQTQSVREKIIIKSEIKRQFDNCNWIVIAVARSWCFCFCFCSRCRTVSLRSIGAVNSESITYYVQHLQYLCTSVHGLRCVLVFIIRIEITIVTGN